MRRRSPIKLLLVLSLFLLNRDVLSQHDDGFIIAGYLPDYCTFVNVTSTSEHLSDLILFSIQPTAQGALDDCCLTPHQFKDDSNTRLWVSIGGMGRSQAFPLLESRATFLTNLLAFCQEHGLYGVDLYWDDPKTRQDIAAYSYLIKETAQVLHENGIMLSITTRQFFAKEVIDKVDRINVMAYDLIQKGGRPHHAAMKSVINLVDNLIYQGVPPSKLILGIAAYARHKDDPTNVRTFAELVEDGYRELTQSSYKGYLFDSPGRVKRKVKWAKKKKLGGVFLWELGQDKQVRGAPGGMLLEAAAVGEYKLLDEL
jgi:GH18 family chitinase